MDPVVESAAAEEAVLSAAEEAVEAEAPQADREVSIAAAVITATNFFMVITPCFVNWFVVWQTLQNRLPSLFQSNVFHRSFPLLCCVRNKKLPLHRNPPVQGQITIYLWCHLACRNYKLRPLCREPTFPCPVTGAARQRILKALAFFPVPSANHYAVPLCAPFPATGALCGCAVSFTFASLV